jgi:hypothetical protein
MQPFSDMSRHFIQVRYGNFPATRDLFDRMKALQLSTLNSQPLAHEQ